MRQFVFFLLLLFSCSLIAQEKPIGSTVTKDLIEKMDQNKNNELIRINIRMASQFEIQNIDKALINLDRDKRKVFVAKELKDFSERTQKGVLSFLDSKVQENKAQIIYSLWINNVVTCLASNEVISDLSRRNDIDRIDWDESRKMIIENEILPEDKPEGGNGGKEITWNVSKVNVPAVWALGFTGAGIKVGVLDTGVNYNHVDLADHMWIDPSYPNHGYDFVNSDNNPMDDHGHGTHCAGTVAGDGTAGSQTGMAPEATIIALKVLDAGGSGTESGVWAAIQFMVDHGGDVISMSLGWQHSWGVDRASWRNAYNNALAAGVIAAVAAGNEGDSQGTYPIPDNVRTPGDCPPPWSHPDQTLTGGLSAVVCVGATDINDDIASFSSRGPVTWSAISPFNDYAYNPGMGLIRPDVSAPGANIKSLDYASNTGYADGWSGTSMATPCVAGVMALMLNKNPNLTPSEIDMALETTALELGTTGKDNVYGSGRVNALAAVNYVNYPGPVYNSHTITDPNSNGQVEAGENISLSLEMYNGSDIAVNNVVVTISSPSPFITITDNTENYGNFSIWQYKTIPNGFAFNVAANTPGMETIRINISATNGIETWTSFFDITTYGPSIQLGNITVSDPLGNNNGRLDPGETVDLIIAAENIGQVAISNVLVAISSASGFITLNNLTVNIPNIPAAGSVNAVFNMTVNNAAPVGTNIDFHFDMTAGVYSNQKNAVLTVGLIVEDWETGNFGKFPWAFGGSANWTITNVGPYEGIYTTKSGTITHSQLSDLTIDIEVISAGNISFFRKVSSEAGWDYLRFYIDGVLQGEWAGEVEWSEVIYPVSVGTHTFKWTYYKDTSVNSGSDCAWVDFIIFPPIAPPPNPADIVVNPLSFEVTLPVDASTSQQMNLGNMGDLDLNFTITKQYIESGKTPLAYCAASGGCDEYISRVVFNTIDNNSGTCSPGGYFDYTSYSTNVDGGFTYNLIVTIGNYYSTDDIGAWIDWNQDQDFTDAGENVACAYSTPSISTFSILIPTDAPSGATTMRIRLKYSGSDCGTSCGITTYGEVEDYTINVNNSSFSWLTVSPTSGTVAGQGTSPITLTFDSQGLAEGDYHANVKISSNDPDEVLVIVPCTLHVASQVNLDIIAFLEGPYNGATMTQSLTGLVPLNQPYNTAPWNYTGSESVVTVPALAIDWVLIELRDATSAGGATSGTRIGRKAAFIRNDGRVIGLTGNPVLDFGPLTLSNSLFVIVHHRNHISVLSATGLTQTGGIYTYNFSTGSGQAYGGTAAHKQIGPGVWGMYGGDGDKNGSIGNGDKSPLWDVNAGTKGYHGTDYNLDSQSNNLDKDNVWVPNFGKGSQVPN